MLTTRTFHLSKVTYYSFSGNKRNIFKKSNVFTKHLKRKLRLCLQKGRAHFPLNTRRKKTSGCRPKKNTFSSNSSFPLFININLHNNAQLYHLNSLLHNLPPYAEPVRSRSDQCEPTVCKHLTVSIRTLFWADLCS